MWLYALVACLVDIKPCGERFVVVYLVSVFVICVVGVFVVSFGLRFGYLCAGCLKYVVLMCTFWRCQEMRVLDLVVCDCNIVSGRCESIVIAIVL